MRSFRKRQLLVDHGQDPSTGRIDRYHGAIHVAQGIHRRRTHHRILAGGDVAVGQIIAEGTRIEALVIMRVGAPGMTRADGVIPRHAATAKSGHVSRHGGILADLPGLEPSWPLWFTLAGAVHATNSELALIDGLFDRLANAAEG